MRWHYWKNITKMHFRFLYMHMRYMRSIWICIEHIMSGLNASENGVFRWLCCCVMAVVYERVFSTFCAIERRYATATAMKWTTKYVCWNRINAFHRNFISASSSNFTILHLHVCNVFTYTRARTLYVECEYVQGILTTATRCIHKTQND